MENGTNSSSSDSNSENNNAIVSMENFNCVASWVSTSVVSAFFSSLERFSCVNVSTTDPDDDDEAPDLPLAYSANSQRQDSSDLPV